MARWTPLIAGPRDAGRRFAAWPAGAGAVAAVREQAAALFDVG
jgi:hypothetical protein